jgi:hypothetical protein
MMKTEENDKPMVLKRNGNWEGEDTYSDKRYILKIRGDLSEKKRRCMRCESHFLSKNDSRICLLCKEREKRDNSPFAF